MNCDNQKVLVKDNDIKERRREYFNKLLNEDSNEHRIRVIEIKKSIDKNAY